MSLLHEESAELFKGRHFNHEIITLCVRWYVTYKLSYRDLVEMIHVLVVVFVKEGELRLAMRRIVGGVNVQDNHGWGFRKGSHLLFLALT